jgi:hypothetical protein
VPRVIGNKLGSGMRFVGLHAAGTDKDVDAFAAKILDAAAERSAGGQGGVDERENDDRDAEGSCLGENAEGVGVADALCPFVDRVVRGRGDDDCVGRAGSRLAWLAVLAADWVTGLGFDGGHVQEVECGRGGHDIDGPAVVLGELDELADFGGRACGTDDDGQHVAGLGHSVTPMRRAKSSAWR